MLSDGSASCELCFCCRWISAYDDALDNPGPLLWAAQTREMLSGSKQVLASLLLPIARLPRPAPHDDAPRSGSGWRNLTPAVACSHLCCCCCCCCGAVVLGVDLVLTLYLVVGDAIGNGTYLDAEAGAEAARG